MATILFDQPQARAQLLPITFTRPISEIRIGIFTISEKWSRVLNTKISWLTEPYLSAKFPALSDEDNIYINGSICPSKELREAISTLEPESSLYNGDTLVSFKTTKNITYDSLDSKVRELNLKSFESDILSIDHPWDIFKNNGDQIRSDINLLTTTSNKIEDHYTKVYNPNGIYIEEGAKVKAAILNAEDGPIYLGKNSEVKEGAMIRGPFALCENSVVNMGAKLIGDNTIGPYCKVGGEISNSVIQGYSNKSHDGFLGNSVIGEWCNIGADTNTSNLKNNYAKVKLWDYTTERFQDTGLQFCGLIMGDHAKCGINTMFNTGTVVGVGANVFGEGFPRNYIPSFAWGGSKGYSTFRFDKFKEMTETVMQRRNLELNSDEKEILEHIYTVSAKHRFWENK